jgi:hypothetical protein
MKNIILSCAFALAALETSAQNIEFQPTEHFPEWTAARHQLTGAVKTVQWTNSNEPYVWTVFEFDKLGHITTKSQVGTGAPQISAIRTMSTNTYTYNQKNQLLSIVQKGLHDNYLGKSTYEHKANNIVDVRVYTPEDEKKIHYCYKLEVANDLVKWNGYYRDTDFKRISSFTDFDFDAKGRLTSSGRFLCINGSNCDPSYTERYVYNDKGLLTTIKNDGLMHELKGDITFEHDAQGRIILQKNNGNSPSSYSFEYNDQNQITKITYTPKDKKQLGQVETFEYDAKGNWTVYVRTIDGKDYRQTREIAYY